MKHLILQVGKTTDARLTSLVAEYCDRISHYLSVEWQTVEPSNNKQHDLQRREEGERLLKRMKDADYVVLLDEAGSEYRSTELADWLRRKLNSGRRIVFVIGGAYGFSESVYARANEKISLSRITFSHQLVRLVFAEQLYRVCTILHGESYHH